MQLMIKLILKRFTKTVTTKMKVTLLKVMMRIAIIVHLSLLLPDTLHPHILWRPSVCLLFSNRGGRCNEGGGGVKWVGLEEYINVS